MAGPASTPPPEPADSNEDSGTEDTSTEGDNTENNSSKDSDPCTRPKDESPMYEYQPELFRNRQHELQSEAAAATRARRLYLARRSARRGASRAARGSGQRSGS